MSENEEKIFDVSLDETYADDRSWLTVFVQVLSRKIWKLMSVNLLYLIFNLPAIFISILIAGYMLLSFLPSMQDVAGESDLFIFLLIGTFPAVMFLMAVPAISVGPAQAGMTYLLRCFSYEKPTFYWSDFKDKMKENLKQGFVAGFINLLVIVFILADLYLYAQIQLDSVFLPLANGILFTAFIVFLMMNLYLYPMMVTYHLNIKALYKNALLFSLSRFLPNIAILILCFLLIAIPILIVHLTANTLAVIIAYLYYALLGFSLPGLVINFMVNPVIDKYMNPANSNMHTKK